GQQDVLPGSQRSGRVDLEFVERVALELHGAAGRARSAKRCNRRSRRYAPGVRGSNATLDGAPGAWDALSTPRRRPGRRPAVGACDPGFRPWLRVLQGRVTWTSRPMP